jgi:hypothetical protein
MEWHQILNLFIGILEYLIFAILNVGYVDITLVDSLINSDTPKICPYCILTYRNL